MAIARAEELQREAEAARIARTSRRSRNTTVNVSLVSLDK